MKRVRQSSLVRVYRHSDTGTDGCMPSTHTGSPWHAALECANSERFLTAQPGLDARTTTPHQPRVQFWGKPSAHMTRGEGFGQPWRQCIIFPRGCTSAPGNKDSVISSSAPGARLPLAGSLSSLPR